MHILLCGASGFLGSALRSHLAAAGHDLTLLVRREPTTDAEVRWDPYRGELDPSVVAAADTVINMSGAPIARWPVTSSYKQQILDSRVAATHTISDAVAGVDDKPALVSQSGISFYGDRGDESLDEDSPPGQTFLAGVAQQWEAATAGARDAGARVVILRTGVVLDGSGGALRLMKLPFLVGVGGRLGSGEQWFPSISLRDYVAAVTLLATDSSAAGVYNMVAPVAATNADLTAALGKRLHRPTLLATPAFAIRAIAGDLSSEVLGSVNASPRRLMELGFTFEHPTIEAQVDAALAHG